VPRTTIWPWSAVIVGTSWDEATGVTSTWTRVGHSTPSQGVQRRKLETPPAEEAGGGRETRGASVTRAARPCRWLDWTLC